MRCLECGVDMKINRWGYRSYDMESGLHWSCYEVGCPISQAVGRRDGNNYCYFSLGVRDDWWFAPRYRIPFRVNDSWLSVEAPYYPTINTGQVYINTRGIIGSQPETWIVDRTMPGQHFEVVSLPFYTALPQNEDFYAEWPKLKDYIEKCLLLI